MQDDKGKFQFSGLRFLYDMELIDDPQLINNMKLNIFDVSGSIKEVDLLSSYHHKSMLIWLDVSWLGKKFLEKRIVAGVTDKVQQLLPNFRFRVTTDRKIFDLALERVKTVLKGENNEKVPTATSLDDGSKSGAPTGEAPAEAVAKPDSSGDPEIKS